MLRNILVTGGAKRLGAIIARGLAAEGRRVVIHCFRSNDEAEALAKEINAAGVVKADLSDIGSIADLFARARQVAGGRIDGIVNSASSFYYDRPPAVDPALLERFYAIGHSAPVLLASALAQQDDLTVGAVVNLLDQKVANLNPDFYSYTAGKVALFGATTMLSQAVGPRIRVNAVAPGLTLPSGDQTQEEFCAVATENLLRRPVASADVVSAVSFLLDARGLSGQTIFVDNGQRFVRRGSDVMFERNRG